MKLEKFLNTYPIWAAYKLHERLVAPMQKILKQRELTFLQSLILAAIYFENSPVSPSELVKLFGTSLPNMSHSLKHLRTLGLVERSVDSVDSRRIKYILTTPAHSSLEGIIALHHNAQEDFERKLSTHEITIWCEFAKRFTQR
ncbi:MAG: MarR family transcriptional regulator [Myxococcales bacterium]|nr:MarR family transcriptional regulator [Myxococcales bacterium]USN51374.1 MAG: MarR family transcriptional regulator [Myxococcales bacterium]